MTEQQQEHFLKQEAQLAQEMAQETEQCTERFANREVNFGCCKFCGQVQPLKNGAWMTQERADEYITSRCDCPHAVQQRNMDAARRKINETFSECSAECREVLIETAKLVQAGHIENATFKLSECVKRKVTQSSKGFLVITRTDTETRQETV